MRRRRATTIQSARSSNVGICRCARLNGYVLLLSTLLRRLGALVVEIVPNLTFTFCYLRVLDRSRNGIPSKRKDDSRVPNKLSTWV